MLKSRTKSSPTHAIDSAVLEGVLWMTVHGPINREVGDVLTERSSQLLQEHGLQQVVLDFRAASLIEGTVNLIARVKAVDALPTLRAARVVIICAVRTTEYEFFEATARQHGHRLRVFTDGARALAWLKDTAAD